MKLICLALCVLLAGVRLSAETPIQDVLSAIDSGTGRIKDPTTEFTIKGVVAARIVLSDQKTVAFVLESGQPALAVMAENKEAANLLPRNEVTLSGKLGDGPFGAALQLKPGSVSLSATNKSFGLSEPRDAGFFKDASPLAGRWVQLTNVTLSAGKAGAYGTVKAKGVDGAELTLRTGAAAVGRDLPSGPLNIFGIPVKVAGEWQLVAARFLQSDIKAMQLLATKHTCFTCHNPDVKMVGPAYREVAAKYRNDGEARLKLIAQMENGGAGKWGPVAMMPFKGKIPPAEMNQLADWILGYRWDAVLAE